MCVCTPGLRTWRWQCLQMQALCGQHDYTYFHTSLSRYQFRIIWRPYDNISNARRRLTIFYGAAQNTIVDAFRITHVLRCTSWPLHMIHAFIRVMYIMCHLTQDPSVMGGRYRSLMNKRHRVMVKNRTEQAETGLPYRFWPSSGSL